jgi:DNA-binding NtrC family response regulator
MLLAHFVERAANSLGKPCPLIPRKIAGILKTYQWPGNVRELEGMCFDAVARLEGNTLSIEQFRLEGAMPGLDAVASGADQDFVRTLDRLPTLELAVDSLVTEALHRASGNQTMAAEMLGISRQALNKRLTRRKAGNRF